MLSKRIRDGTLLRIPLWTSVAAKRQHPMAISTHQPPPPPNLLANHNLSVKDSILPWVFWCYFSSLACAAVVSAHNVQGLTVCSHSAPQHCVRIYFILKKMRSERSERKGKYTASPCTPLFRGLLQISPLFTNESLEGCNLQSVPSDAIRTSTASKGRGNHYHNSGMLPAWVALDISKTCNLLMGLNRHDLEEEPWEF